jgi:hypothetical protein
MSGMSSGIVCSSKRRQMLREVLCVQILLKSYGKQRGLDVKETSSHVIFVYGKCSIPKPFVITGAELDEHFGWPVQEQAKREAEEDWGSPHWITVKSARPQP